MASPIIIRTVAVELIGNAVFQLIAEQAFQQFFWCASNF